MGEKGANGEMNVKTKSESPVDCKALGEGT